MKLKTRRIRRDSARIGPRQEGALRLAARGLGDTEAIARALPVETGLRARLAQRDDLEAARYGMPSSLLELTRRPGVTDILINGRDVWVDRGGGLESIGLDLGDEVACRLLAIRMAAAAGQRLDDASPIVDATINGDLRLHAVLPPLARGGVSVSLRVIRTHAFSLQDLVETGTLRADTAREVHQWVKAGQSILISGATGVGKTTLLATLLGLVPTDQRIVCIEEVSELAADHPHVVRLQARQANVEGEGELGLEDLVRAAVRMRPDRLVLGECRGAEVREVLTALNTGHQGSFATIHANSIEDVPARLLALGMLGGMSESGVGVMAESAFDRVIHMRRSPCGRRYVSELGRLVRGIDGLHGLVDVQFVWNGS